MKDILSALRAAGEPTRFRILGLLGHGELSVSEITEILEQSQPRVSRHLKILMDANLIKRFSEGTWAFFRLQERLDEGHLVRTLVDLIPSQDPEHLSDLYKLKKIRERRQKMAGEYFKIIAEDWNKIRNLYISEEEVEGAVLSLLKPIKINSFLDIGTGTGRMLEIMAPFIKDGLGIDQSREMLSIARPNLANNCQVRQGDMYDLPAKDETHDGVLFHQVLHYADQPHKALSEATRVLKKGGTLLIVDFAPHNLEFLREEHSHRHLGFSEKAISDMGCTCGLIEKSVTHLDGGELTVTIWIFEKPLNK